MDFTRWCMKYKHIWVIIYTAQAYILILKTIIIFILHELKKVCGQPAIFIITIIVVASLEITLK